MIFIFGCESSIKNEVTYFGGHVKNPKDIDVIIYKGDIEIASTKLNQDQKFLIKIDSLKAGLYTFKNGEEFQYIYLEPKDSLLIRLNTWDFDESLVFSGKGAERNNFLIQLFLENESQEKLFYSYYKLNETDFVKKTDSLIQLKTIQFNQFKDGTVKQSKAYLDLVYAAIYFPVFSNKEKYPIHFKHNNHLKKLPTLSDDFYDYRKNINLNQDLFINYYTHKNYLWNHIYNTSLYKHEIDSLSNLSVIILKQISKIIKKQKLKNAMLQKTFINSLIDNSCTKRDSETAERIFFKNCTDKKRKKEVDNLINAINTFKKDTNLPSFQLKNTKDKILDVKNIITKNTVIYFWPRELNRIQNMAKRVNYLTKKHTDIHFIGIDFQLDNYNWKSYIKANNLNRNNQFQLANKSESNFFTKDIPRAIILDQNSIIQSDFTFLSHPNFEQKLLIFEKNTHHNALTNK